MVMNECVMEIPFSSVTQFIVSVVGHVHVCLSVCLSVVYSQCSVVILYQNNDHMLVSKMYVHV